jgi:hypothetical protein
MDSAEQVTRRGAVFLDAPQQALLEDACRLRVRARRSTWQALRKREHPYKNNRTER